MFKHSGWQQKEIGFERFHNSNVRKVKYRRRPFDHCDKCISLWKMDTGDYAFAEFHYFIDHNVAIYQCCRQVVITEFASDQGITILDDYEPYLSEQKVIHRHACDAKTRVRVLEQIAIEKRLLNNPDKNDWVYFSDGGRK